MQTFNRKTKTLRYTRVGNDRVALFLHTPNRIVRARIVSKRLSVIK